MSTIIFHLIKQDAAFEAWLEVEDDGSLTFTTSPIKRYPWKPGDRGEAIKLTPEEAKQRWPSFTEEIERAVSEASSKTS